MSSRFLGEKFDQEIFIGMQSAWQSYTKITHYMRILHRISKKLRPPLVSQSCLAHVWCLSVVVAGWILFASALVAQTIEFEVKSFKIEGPNPVSEEQTRVLLAPFLGVHTDLERLQDAAQVLEGSIRDTGFAFYRVNLPPQTLDSTEVTLKIIDYRVNGVAVKGNKHFSDDNIKRSLPQLSKGHSPNIQRLSRELALANEHPTKKLETRFGVDPQTGELNAKINVRDRNPINYFSWLDNTGSSRTGNLRLGMGLQHTNLWELDHILTTTVTTSPSRPKDVRQFGLDYRLPLYRRLGQLSFIVANSTVDTGEIAQAFDVRGSGDVFGIRFRHLLPKTEKLRHSLSLELFDKHFDNDIRFEQTPIGNKVRSRPLSLLYDGIVKLDKGSLSLNAGLSHNVSGGSDNTDDAYRIVRLDADTDWTVLRAGSNLALQFGKWAVNGTLDVQLTNDSLIPGEQLALGGIRTVRGFGESEVTNDEGLRVSLELWSPIIMEGLRAIGFFDYGLLKRNRPLEGEVARDSISSAGVGLRWNYQERLSTRVDLGVVLDSPTSQQIDVSEDGDLRLHFSLIYRFGHPDR